MEKKIILFALITVAVFFILKNKKNNLLSIESKKKDDKLLKEINSDKKVLDLKNVSVEKPILQRPNFNPNISKTNKDKYLVSPVRQIFSL